VRAPRDSLHRAQSGASDRGLHDSWSNYPRPMRRRRCCLLHEESAVAIRAMAMPRHGRLMAAARAHSNVGMMHASMAIFNAGATACVLRSADRSGRRDEAPPMDRMDPKRTRSGRAHSPLHSNGDRPAGLARGPRGGADECFILAHAVPMGPVYVNLDAEMQEGKLPNHWAERGRALHATVATRPRPMPCKAARC